MIRNTAILACIVLFVSASTGHALTIEVLASSADAANIDNGDSGATSVVDDSGDQMVNAAPGAQGYAYGAYEYQAWGDTYGGNEDHTFTHMLSTTFTVIPDNASIVYDIAFGTQRKGSLGKDDDTWSSYTVYSSAHIGELTGTINGTNAGVLSLPTADYTGNVGVAAVNQTSADVSYTGQTGTTTWTVATTWTTRVTSNYDESGVSMGEEVGAWRLDLVIPTDVNAGVRTNAILTITAIPEPSTALLVSLGFDGLGAISPIRRKI